MSIFSCNRDMSLSGLESNADKPDNFPYVYLDPELRRDLFQGESENYSELSVDTSSNSSLKLWTRTSQNIYAPEQAETRFAYGSSDGGTSSPLELPEIPIGLQYSEDEMSDILSLDPQYIQRAALGEDEELRYLQDVVQKARCYDEFEYVPPQDIFWNMDVAHESNVDFLPSDSLMWNTLCEEERLRWLILNESQTNLYRMLQQEATDQPFVAKSNQTSANTLNQGRRPRRAQKERQILKPPPSIPVMKKDRKAKTSPASDGDKRIFLGGLPAGMTERTLRQQIALLGYKVMKRPKILRGFAPEVLMRSAQEAKALVDKGTIMINGFEVEVRPFNALMKQSESRKIPNVNKRSVFLGGLSEGTTAKDIQDAFSNMGIRILNYPVIKFGFSKQVILKNVHQAKALIEKKKILIRGTLVDVRPFVRQKSRKVTH